MSHKYCFSHMTPPHDKSRTACSCRACSQRAQPAAGLSENTGPMPGHSRVLPLRHGAEQRKEGRTCDGRSGFRLSRSPCQSCSPLPLRPVSLLIILIIKIIFSLFTILFIIIPGSCRASTAASTHKDTQRHTDTLTGLLWLFL